MPHARIDRRRKKAQSREGMVLLLVLLILTMATGTATFAMHTTGHEIRAAASMRTAMRARNYADAVGLAAVLATESTTSLCEDTNGENLGGGWKYKSLDKYGFPAITWNGADYAIRDDWEKTKFDAGSSGFLTSAVPDDYALRYAPNPVPAGTYPVSSNAWAMFECRKLASGSSGATTFRMKFTVFGEQGFANDATIMGVADGRGSHEAVSISRTLLDSPQ